MLYAVSNSPRSSHPMARFGAKIDSKGTFAKDADGLGATLKRMDELEKSERQYGTLQEIAEGRLQFLREHHNTLEKDYQALQQRYNELQKQHSVLQQTYQSLQSAVKDRVRFWIERFQEVNSAYSRDPLTGLYNRRFFDKQMKQAFHHRPGQSPPQPLGVLMIDLDKFKLVNDQFGHDAGDHALKSTARILQGAVKKTDFVCRLGGEEIAVILPGAGPKQLQRVANKILHGLVDFTQQLHGKTKDLEVSSTDPLVALSQQRDLSASIGGISLEIPNKDLLPLDSMMKHIDDLLYVAKEETPTKPSRNQALLVSMDKDGNMSEPITLYGPAKARIPQS